MPQLYLNSTPFALVNRPSAWVICFALLITQSFFGTKGHSQVSGSVYRDFNGNGVRNTSLTYNEPGAAGITVKAYNAAGTLLSTKLSNASGAYSFSVGEIPAATKVRLEFSGWQTADFPAPYGANNKSSTQFATAPSTTADFAINYPGDYIDNLTARVIVPGYGNGDNQANTNNWYDAKNHDAVYAFDYGSASAANILSDMGQIGAVWGTTYHKKADKLFYASFVKRHVSLGPLGINGIYVTTGAKAITNKSNTSNFVNLNAVNPAFDAGSLAGRSFSPGNSDKRNANRDDVTGGNVFNEVGKKGIGGMTISDDGKYLYLINLNDRKLWRVEIGANGTAPTLASQIVAYNSFNVVEGNSSFRPFAVKFYRGSIYIGGVLDGVKPDNSSVNRSELKAIVLKVDANIAPGSASFTTVLDAPLTFNRRANMNTGFGVNRNSNYVDPNGTIPAATLCQGSWHPWARTFNEVVVPPGSNKIIYPQPMLSSLDFDPSDGAMILGITDRTGHQAGNANYGPTSMGNNTLYTSNAAGDILKAANNGNYSLFTLENNGNSGANTTNGANNGEGPGGGEFYFTDRYEAGQGGVLGIGNTANGANAGTSHEETSTGSVVNFPGKELIATAFDPIDNWYTGGVRYYANNDGIAKNGKVLYQGQDASVFGKANGLGDLEIICAPAPIEIGNRVWFDANGNGVQDADELGIAGVKVTLLKYVGPGSAHQSISQATTDANGNYIFSSDVSRTSTGSEKYGIPELQPNTDFKIFINGVSGSSPQAPLVGLDLTLANNGGSDPNADERDSDGTSYTLSGTDLGSAVDINTGIAGANNHSYDFGFATIGSVGGGGGGGVESKSLGDAIAFRVYTQSVKSENGPVDYAKSAKPATVSNVIRNNSTGNQLKLKDILPTKLSDSKYNAYISTPNYLVGITNAKDVLAIDFVEKQVTKAVSFGTETSGEVYNHTKAICDRLKGYELTSIQNLLIKGINLVQYNLKNNDGSIEYAMSFVIGTKNGRNSYTIQSNWLNQNYDNGKDDAMYNIQLWGGSPSLIMEMATDIITRLGANMPINELSSKAGLPKVYFTAGKRVDENVTLTVKNNLSATNGYVEIKDRANEQSTGLVKRTLPITIDANGMSTISIPSSDLFESTISLFVNGKLEDEVFMADGAWGVDYNTNTTSVKSFKVTNATTTSNTAKDDFKVFRNAELVGTTPDYLTLYKLLRAGGIGQDLNAFKSLKFTASGNRPLIITLVKQSIAKWEDQYTLSLPISKESQEYVIGLDEFKSKGINTPINANDISSIVISMGPTTANQPTEVSLNISNVSFSKEDIVYIRSLQERNMTIFPNPATDGRFNVKFKCDKDNSLTLKIIEAATGKIITSKVVNAMRGDNQLPVEINHNSGQKMYILSLDGTGVKYKATKIVAGKN